MAEFTEKVCDTMAALPEGGDAMWSARIDTAREQGMQPLAQATMERWFHGTRTSGAH